MVSPKAASQITLNYSKLYLLSEEIGIKTFYEPSKLAHYFLRGGGDRKD